MSQWSTLRSGPLATWKKDEKGPKCRESREPVVHFGEWTTSYMEKDEKGPKCRKSGELVDHFGEWTTSYMGKGRKEVKSKILCKNM